MKGITTLVLFVTLVFAGIASFYFLEHQKKDELLASSLDNIAQLQDEFRQLEGQIEHMRQQVNGTGDAVSVAKAEAEKWRGEAARLLEDRDRLEKQVKELGAQVVASIAQTKTSTDPPETTESVEPGAEPAGTAPAPEEDVFGALQAALKPSAAKGELLLRKDDSGPVIAVPSRNLFGPGPADLKEEGKAILSKAARAIKASGKPGLRIEAHTDNVPMGPKYRDRFPTNKELSEERARVVAGFVAGETGIASDRLVAAGLADSKPTASNDTAEGRAKNSRIEIRLVR